MVENNILPLSEDSQRKELVVEDWYKLEHPLVPQKGEYKLRVIEFEQEISYFKDLELIKIIHPKSLNLNVINNKIVFYKDVIKPSLITDSDGKEVKLREQNSVRGKKGDALRLKFDDFSAEHKLLVLIASLRAGYPRIKTVEQMLGGIKSFDEIKKYLYLINAPFGILVDPFPVKAAECTSCGKVSSIIVSISICQGDKVKEIEIIHPREKASVGLLDLSDYLTKSKESLEFRLEWTNTHNLEPVGLAKLATKEEMAGVKTETLKPISVKHFQESKLADKSLEEVELKPGQYLELAFPGKEKPLEKGETVSFVVKSKGYYKKV